jgi:hypothetical protein
VTAEGADVPTCKATSFGVPTDDHVTACWEPATGKWLDLTGQWVPVCDAHGRGRGVPEDRLRPFPALPLDVPTLRVTVAAAEVTAADYLVRHGDDRESLRLIAGALPPAAAVTLTDADRVALDAAVGALGTEDYPGLLFDEVERIVAARVQQAEAERDRALRRAAHSDERCDMHARDCAQAEAKVERVEALIPDVCWTRSTPWRVSTCADLIGATFGNAATWTEEMCCLPCRLRAALDGTR